MELPSDMPSPDTIRGIVSDLQKALANASRTRERMLDLSGTAWSDDGMVKVTVGPRGQLVDIDIDPRVFRKPDSQALRASILAANHAAVQQVLAEIEQLMLEQLPPELAELRARYDPEAEDPIRRNLLMDADVLARRRVDQP